MFERQVDRLPFEDLVAPPARLEDLPQALELARSRRWARVSVDTSDI